MALAAAGQLRFEGPVAVRGETLHRPLLPVEMDGP